MFGVSLTEFVLIMVVALVVLGPQRLPGMLRTAGIWISKIRRMTTEVRAQTGIDDLLRNEGISGGLTEVRALLRGDPRPFLQPTTHEVPTYAKVEDPYANGPAIDAARERPTEGPDAYSAIPEDLYEDFSADPAPRAQAAATLTVDAASTTSVDAHGAPEVSDPSKPTEAP